MSGLDVSNHRLCTGCTKFKIPADFQCFPSTVCRLHCETPLAPRLYAILVLWRFYVKGRKQWFVACFNCWHQTILCRTHSYIKNKLQRWIFNLYLFEAVIYFYLNGEIPVIVLGNQDDGTMIGARHNYFLMTQFKLTVDSNVTFFIFIVV